MGTRRRRVRRYPDGLFNVEITSLNHNGQGVGRLDNRVVFIDNALPGEQVEFQYTLRQKHHDEGVATQILNPSKDRVLPRCEFYAHCGGCRLQHLAPEAQIQFKQQQLANDYEHIGLLNLDKTQWVPPLHATSWHYRTKARLGVKRVAKKNKVLVGFREKNSPFITDMTYCDVLDQRVAELIAPLQTLIAALSIHDQIPQIELAAADQVCLIFRILAPLTEPDQQQLMHFARQHNILLKAQPKGPASIYNLWPREQPLLHYPVSELNIEFAVNDFTQVNQEINQQMVKQAIDWLALDAQDKVLDLFCGLGNFTLPVARQAGQVTGVEGDQALVDKAVANARLNQITNVEFVVDDLFTTTTQTQWYKDFKQAGWNKVLLDPPRSGAKEIIPLIARHQPERIVYVSCNPATLARDAGLLVNAGYKLHQTGVMDMFPHTAHVESMALFIRS